MTTIYKLTRDLSGDRELIHLSTERSRLADLIRVDIDKWTVPVTYTIELTFDFDDFFIEGRIDAFREAVNISDKLAADCSNEVGFNEAYRYVACKLFRLMKQEIGK